METIKPRLIKLQNTYDIIIPAEVEEKIRLTCKKIWEVEWSGILFYTYEGNFEDNNLKIICKDFFVMDMGSSGYTEFMMSPDVANYIAENIELSDYQIGLIHSHNNMAKLFA